ncbi:MAG TPA: AAA family ATPase [Anaerolineae bacterium]|nr:AAA family ATPase [Anaerolineae bacterium]
MIDLLSAYIPSDRRRALARGETLPDRAAGAALFADIHGFTPLTEMLTAQLGERRGAEELTRQLNRVYDALIAEVDRYGGSVVSFSGDGITCWFDDAHSPAAPRAATCAWAMQQAMAPFASFALPNGGTASLAVKVAVAAGPVRRFLVGDPQIQLIDTLAGETLVRMARGEHLAGRGETLVDEPAATACGDLLRMSEWRSDASTGERFAVVGGIRDAASPAPASTVETGTPGETQVLPWLLPAVHERLRDGLGEFITELRPAVAVFLRFLGIDFDGDDEAGQKLDRYVRWVQDVVARYEGTLLQLTIGDKGRFTYAAFGAPIAHEDDAQHAVSAALELRAPPPEVDYILSSQIGVSRGLMRVGTYGSATRRTYGVHGDEVNLAARLMERAAPGEVLASGRVYKATARTFTWEALSEITVKGKAKPVPVYRPLAQRRAARRDLSATIVGRAGERAALAEALHALRRGESAGVMIVEGEAGIGKSRLAADLLEQAWALGVLGLLGTGDAIERNTSYYAWRPIFSYLLDLSALPDDSQARHEHVLARLQSDPEALRLAPLLNAVLPLDIPDSDLTAQMAGQVRADNTRDLLLRLLQDAASQSPTLLVLEDAHWLDSASWALALAAAQRVRPILIVVVTRPLSDPPPAEYGHLLQMPTVRRLRLDTLPPGDTLALVCQRLGVAGLPEPVAALIRDKAEGHPFFSEELAYALRDAGLIQVADGECRLAPGAGDLGALNFPDTVQGVITSRIDRLAPAQQLTLKVASVVGRVFAFRLLRDIYPIDAESSRLAQDLDTLDRLDLTPLQSPEPNLQYLFKHVITQEVAYSLMLFSQRRPLHLAVAEWHERHHADDLAPYYTVLAYHWKEAAAEQTDPQLVAKAIDYLEKAGNQALRNYANQEALGLFEDLLRLADANPSTPVGRARRGRWEAQIAEACLNLGRLTESRDHFHKALSLLGYPPPLKPLTLAADMLKHVAIQTAHRLRPARFVGRARDRRGALLEVAYVFQQVQKIYFYFAESLLLLNVTLRGLNLSESAGPSPELARNYASMCAISGLLSLHGPAVKYGNLALDTARQINDQPALAWACLATGLYYVGVGNWTKSDALLEEALEVFARLGDRRQWEESCSVIAPTYYYRGLFERSAEYRHEAYLSALDRGDRQVQIWGAVGEAQCALRLGQMDKAVELIDRALSLIGESEDTVWAYGVAALIHWRRGDLDLAREMAAKAEPYLHRFRPTAAQVLAGYAGLAEVCLGFWEEGRDGTQAPALKQKARNALKGLRTFARTFPIGRPALLRLQGVYAWLDGKPKEAMQAWQKSLTEAERLSMPHSQARAHYEIARRTSGADREHHAARAVEIFERLGMVHDLALARALMK